MNIALVILHADPKRGGAERYTADLAAALAKRGHAVSLLSASFADVPAQVKTVELPARGITRASRYRRFLQSLAAHLKQVRYDVVHAMLPVPGCDIYHPHAGLAAAAIAAAPVQALLNPRRGAMAAVEQKLLASITPPTLLYLSDYVKKDVLKFYPNLSDSNLAKLFNAVDLDYFDSQIKHDGAGTRKAHRIAEHDVVALIVAQDFSRKGVPQAIAATRQINASRLPSQSRLKLLIVGKGTHSVEDENIVFAGTSEKIAKYYLAADFFVLPTRHDPCSLVVLEALAMGLPVISTMFNGACEVMASGTHGFVLPDPNDVDALVAAMRQLLDSDVRKRMSDACLELRPRLSYQHHLDQLLAIYQRSKAR